MIGAVRERIGIVGASLIGRSWAIVFARAGHDVRIWDQDPVAVARARELLAGSVAELAEAGLVDEPVERIVARVATAASLEDAVGDAAYVQESAVERLDVKCAVFAALDAAAPAECILASSTSTIRASLFAADLTGRHRCLVAHPINPPHLAPIVELAPASFTSPDVVGRARELHLRVGQEPIEVRREIDGFVLNRLQAALLAEAWRLVEEGYASVADVDTTIRAGLGLRWALMGPFETIDLNATGGVGRYGRTYGQLMQALMADRAYGPLSDELIDRVEAERRAILPREELEARAEWRDRRLVRLLAHLRAEAAADLEQAAGKVR
jgi:3-hydroxyacyl-CoA dehydrogenase